MENEQLTLQQRKFISMIVFDENQIWWLTSDESRFIMIILQMGDYSVSEGKMLTEIISHFKTKHQSIFGGPLTSNMNQTYSMGNQFELINNREGTK